VNSPADKSLFVSFAFSINVQECDISNRIHVELYTVQVLLGLNQEKYGVSSIVRELIIS